MFDVLTMAALHDEFAAHIVGGRIQRVLQIGEAGFALEIYAEHQRRTLVASAESRNPRLYLTSARVTAEPDRVTPLLLLLRKYARGGMITGIQQPHLERISRVSIAKRILPHKQTDSDESDGVPEDEGEIVTTHLYVELMGRRSNLILTDESGRILDAARRVTTEMSRVRPILPGRTYEAPPPQVKADPTHLSEMSLTSLLTGIDADVKLSDALVRVLNGFSPQMAREATYRATASVKATLAEIDESKIPALTQAVGQIVAPLETGDWQPHVYTEGDDAVAFSAIRLDHLQELEGEQFPSMSTAIERFLSLAGQSQPVRQSQRRDQLVTEIQSVRQRVASRRYSLEEERQRMAEGERWRTMGELIYAYLYEIQPEQTELNADGVTIPLDPALSPSENAQAYFERYRKSQSAARNLPELIEQTQTELDYLDQLQTLVGFAEGMDDIEQARQEWNQYRSTQDRAAGRSSDRAKRKKQAAPKRPAAYRTERGDLIYVGRNGRQNDLITFDLAGPDDTWLHARDLPGAHVIIHWAGPEEDGLIERAASLAAHFSGGHNATSVGVDVTKRRYVRKIKGAGPGMVTYRNEQTVQVRPRPPMELGFSEPKR